MLASVQHFIKDSALRTTHSPPYLLVSQINLLPESSPETEDELFSAFSAKSKKLNFNQIKYNLEKKILQLVSSSIPCEEKITLLKAMVDSELGGSQSENRIQIFIFAIYELLQASFLTEAQLYSLTQKIIQHQKNSKPSLILDLEESLMPEDSFIESLRTQLKDYLEQNKSIKGLSLPNLSTRNFVLMGIVAFFAAYNGFTGGAEACSMFDGHIFENETGKKVQALNYIVGFVSQAMIWWAFMSASVTPPKFSLNKTVQENASELFSCVFAVGQAIPSALFTNQNERETKLVYFPFYFLKKDSENANISGNVLVCSNFLLNTYFGLGQAQGAKNLYYFLKMRLQNSTTSAQKLEVFYDIISAFLKTMLVSVIFIQPICDLRQALEPTLEWFGRLLLALFLNAAEIKFYMSANMFWGIERYASMAFKHGPKTALKVFCAQNSQPHHFIPTILATMGSLFIMGNTRETLTSILDMDQNTNRNLLTGLLISQFIPGYVGNRATFR
jgi:hypothetical protein